MIARHELIKLSQLVTEIEKLKFFDKQMFHFHLSNVGLDILQFMTG